MEQHSPSPEARRARYRDYLRELAGVPSDVHEWSTIRPSAVDRQTFLKASPPPDAPRDRTEQELAAWLRGVLSNSLAGEFLTGPCPQVATSPGGAPPAGSDAGSGDLAPEEVARRNERLLRLARALARLPDDQRAVLEMKHLYGLTLTEICERTRRSKPAVAEMLFRAVKALRGLMNEAAPGGGPPRA